MENLIIKSINDYDPKLIESFISWEINKSENPHINKEYKLVKVLCREGIGWFSYTYKFMPRSKNSVKTLRTTLVKENAIFNRSDDGEYLDYPHYRFYPNGQIIIVHKYNI